MEFPRPSRTKGLITETVARIVVLSWRRRRRRRAWRRWIGLGPAPGFA